MTEISNPSDHKDLTPETLYGVSVAVMNNEGEWRFMSGGGIYLAGADAPEERSPSGLSPHVQEEDPFLGRRIEATKGVMGRSK